MENLKIKLKNFFRRLYVNSYGFDDLNKALIMVSLVCSILNLFLKSAFLYVFGNALFIYFFFRFFSKKKFKRSEENRRYRRARKYLKLVWDNRKTHRILVCKNCGQFIRVPKGKGKIEVTCPQCSNKIDFRS